MKLTNQDKMLLRGMGHDDKDFPQIEEAMRKYYTTYDLDGETISREQAIALLGREAYLSGISRSAFHYTAARSTDDGRVVGFDSSKLFKG